MLNTEKAIFLSPSDFQFGGIAFKAGFYQVQQLDGGQKHVLIFTRVTGLTEEFATEPWMAEVETWPDGDRSYC
ncbi:MAG TPA: hypothetical protein VLE20_04675 [Blastocatellia bacterium]|nr:hypothetical protein [Blastocatellia bacterium]